MSENDNLKFKKQTLKFFPEDLEKMEKMTVKEKIAFIDYLKKENRYVIVDE